jgi:ribosome maturation factor RimP
MQPDLLGVSGSQSLRNIIEPAVESLGYELVHVERTNQGSNQVLRVYIDAPGGILVDDCALVSRQLGLVLDVEDPISGNYLLEVSSPGIDRPLVTHEHFVK